MTEALGGKVNIYAKRDDCNSGLAMGGNKLRKLEYSITDAIKSNADTLVSAACSRTTRAWSRRPRPRSA